jgi:hypothetical protein
MEWPTFVNSHPMALTQVPLWAVIVAMRDMKMDDIAMETMRLCFRKIGGEVKPGCFIHPDPALR